MQDADCSYGSFSRELSAIIKVPYSKVKISFDVICLAVTFVMTYCFLGHIKGLGIGTVLAAFTLGKVIGIIGEQMDKKWSFTSVFENKKTYSKNNETVNFASLFLLCRKWAIPGIGSGRHKSPEHAALPVHREHRSYRRDPAFFVSKSVSSCTVS